jgi:hypothetical protein
MSWVTVIWSIGDGACLTLALMNFVVWRNDRAARANLVFAVMAIAVATFAALEVTLIRARTREPCSSRGPGYFCPRVADSGLRRWHLRGGKLTAENVDDGGARFDFILPGNGGPST